MAKHQQIKAVIILDDRQSYVLRSKLLAGQGAGIFIA